VSKRTTVKVDIERIEIIIKANGWRNSYFAEVIMKKQRGWVSEWKRGKNFPSPEEAARMCVLLQTTPEEILTEQDDIDLVKGLLDNDPGIKEARATEGEGVDGKIAQFIRSASAEELDEIYRYIDFLKSKRGKK
jgi:transcriptional regulator with XRE-family HTH domain